MQILRDKSSSDVKAFPTVGLIYVSCPPHTQPGGHFELKQSFMVCNHYGYTGFQTEAFQVLASQNRCSTLPSDAVINTKTKSNLEMKGLILTFKLHSSPLGEAREGV